MIENVAVGTAGKTFFDESFDRGYLAEAGALAADYVATANDDVTERYVAQRAEGVGAGRSKPLAIVGVDAFKQPDELAVSEEQLYGS